jgi:hypothetical protein
VRPMWMWIGRVPLANTGVHARRTSALRISGRVTPTFPEVSMSCSICHSRSRQGSSRRRATPSQLGSAITSNPGDREFSQG